MRRLELGTFSALTTAGRMYRRAGFRVTSEGDWTDWGLPVTFQHHALDLSLRHHMGRAHEKLAAECRDPAASPPRRRA